MSATVAGPMRQVAGWTMLASLAVACVSPHHADAAESLTGWEGLRFGMTVEEASHVSGFDWAEPEKLTMTVGSATIDLGTRMKSKAPMRLGDQTFDVEARVDAKDGVIFIELSGSDPANSFAGCENAFINMLAESERQYGAFRARHPAGTERRDPAMFAILQVADWKALVTHHRAPSGKSSYSLRVEMSRKTQADAWVEHKFNEAIKDFGGPNIELRAEFSPEQKCELDIKISAAPVEE